MLECVVNISEGRDAALIASIAGAAGPDLLDVHSDPDHHRSVLTLLGEDAPRSVTSVAVERLSLRDHVGVHPRIGVVDVVPFVPLESSTMANAIAARDRFGEWLAAKWSVPSFFYGPGEGDRTLPEIRRNQFQGFAPDCGPRQPHPTAGAVAVGARPLLVAYNLWLAEPDLDAARAIAQDIRGPLVRTLGLRVGAEVQVSMNLIAPEDFGPAEAFDAVAERGMVGRAELVGLLPEAVLRSIAESRWAGLDLSPSKTIESRRATRARR